MGIKNLNPFLKVYVGGCFQKTASSSLKGKRVAIDGTHMLHKFLAFVIQLILNGSMDPVNDEIPRGEIIDGLVRKFLFQEKSFIDLGVDTIWVFDGKAPKEKEKTKETRIKSRVAAKDKFKSSKEDFDKIDEFDFSKKETALINLIKRRATTTSIDTEMISSVIEKLKDFGIAVAIARSEGELHCASFYTNGLADYVFTTDTDVLAIGSNILTSFNSKEAEMIEIDSILDAFNFTQEQFRDFCILLGCDFNEKLSRVNALSTYELIDEHKSIENIPKAVNQESLNYIKCRELLSPYQIEEGELPNSDCERLEKISNYLFAKKNDFSM